MAQRRLFSQAIVESDAFLDMPISSQALYFHLGMHADDDGFVNPKKIMRLTGSSADDLNVLLTKRFVLRFESGVIVIKHWLIHNTIRQDRYKETLYLEEKNSLIIKDNKAYTELATNGLPDGNQSVTQVKSSKDKISEDNIATLQSNEGVVVNEIIFLFKEVNPSIDKYYGNKTQRAAVQRMLKTYGREKVEEMIAVLPQVNARPYWPKSTTPLELENNIGKYKALNQSEKNKGSSSKIKVAIIN